ncbi:hypothetical protein PhCBS80983_g01987 [Powellomyces hirtus]|uniref:ZFAND1-like ubiquitin-like domain-containing protein n=1 Tax=Powellomyces hirtus TaxID=109895 RepID=A0A507E847_9FUNG|nr:hypothetical protein PhCBS80983_g01987 [Powellomyces hirtus]
MWSDQDHECEATAEQRRQLREKEEAVKNLKRESRARGSGPPRKLKKLNPAIELMKMKMHAKGDKAVPLESRLFYRVYFPTANKVENQPMFFHKDWTVGRAIDAVATFGKIVNDNNMGDASKMLNFYHGDTGELLPTTASFSELTADKRLVSGQSVLLERGGIQTVDPALFRTA